MHGTVSRTHTVCVHFILDAGSLICYPAQCRRKERSRKKTFAYITAAWSSQEFADTDQAVVYCRKAYEAGFTPICPILYLPHFLNDTVPAEHKDGIDMGRELLRRSHVLIVCGDEVDEAVKNDIAVAQRLGITATTLDGILKIRSQGHEEGCAPFPELMDKKTFVIMERGQRKWKTNAKKG